MDKKDSKMMRKKTYEHTAAVFQALLVTFLWSTSFIIIKFGLSEIPPVTFAGLRYFTAALCLLPFILKKRYRLELALMTRTRWRSVILLGIVFYVLTQGIQFIGLSILPSATVSLMLNFTPLFVVLFGTLFLGEKASALQFSGIILFIGGAVLYFLPSLREGANLAGLAVMAVGVLSNAVSSIMGRSINCRKDISPLSVTFISMAAGSIILMAAGLIRNGLPDISVKAWLSIIWLAVVNTAFAFTLWNKTLRTLTAMESSIINGTMLVQIAVLAWIFLREELTPLEISGLIIAAGGAVIVQTRGKIQKKA